MTEKSISTAKGELTFGTLLGNNKILFIKAGLGGDYLGYEDKYLKIAQRAHSLKGFSVISVSNPAEINVGIDADKKILGAFLEEAQINSPELYFLGSSNGCLKGLELASSGLPFKKMLLFNMPLIVNLHKTRKSIKSLQGTEIIAIFGEKDPSFSLAPFLELDNCENLTVKRIPDADHTFSGKTEEFVALGDIIFS